MKRAKLMCCLLVLVLLVSGCSNAPATGTEPPTGQSGVSAFVMPDIPEVSLDPVSVLAEGIYCTGGNYDIGIYPFSFTQFFYVDLFTQEPLPEDASVTLDTSIPYRASITEVKPAGSVEMQHPYYLFQCTQETDWPKMTEAYLKAQYAVYERDTLQLEGIAPSQQHLEQWSQDRDTYSRLSSACEEAYLAQVDKWKNALQPSVYQYRIGFNFVGWDGSVSDVITEATLACNGKSLTLPIGSVRLDGNAACPYPRGNGVETQSLAIGEYPGGTPWGGEYLDISSDLNMKVKKNIKLKDLYIYNNKAKISACAVNVTSMGMTVDQTWSPGTDTMELQEGSEITLHITLADKDLTEREYAKNMVLILEYEQDGETYCNSMDIQVIRRREPYEVYLWAFEGVNTQAYYQQFLNIARSVTFGGE
jgi:hypothetical protein